MPTQQQQQQQQSAFSTTCSSHDRAEPLLPLHHEPSSSSSSPNGRRSLSPPSLPLRNSSFSRRRVRRSCSEHHNSIDNGSSSSHSSTGSNTSSNSNSAPSPINRRQILSPPSTPRSTHSTTHAQVQQFNAARILSGSAVAGFVVGTTFEACLMGLLTLLQLQHTSQTDYPLFVACLSLLVTSSWTGIFHLILNQIDALVDMLPAAVPNSSNGTKLSQLLSLYGHFNGGLALGMGLECIILQYVLSNRKATADTNEHYWLSVVSIVFGMGCLGLTGVRCYYNKASMFKNNNRRTAVPLGYKPLCDGDSVEPSSSNGPALLACMV